MADRGNGQLEKLNCSHLVTKNLEEDTLIKSMKKKCKHKTAKKKITKRQTDTLKKHSKHHSKKHMGAMKKAMRGGSTFTAAHKKAQRKVGK